MLSVTWSPRDFKPLDVVKHTDIGDRGVKRSSRLAKETEPVRPFWSWLCVSESGMNAVDSFGGDAEQRDRIQLLVDMRALTDRVASFLFPLEADDIVEPLMQPLLQKIDQRIADHRRLKNHCRQRLRHRRAEVVA